MKVLVTGGAGYVGSHTAKALLDAGYQVVAFDNLSTGSKKSVPSGCNFIMGDVRDHSQMSYVFKKENVQAIIHTAAKVFVPESFLNPTEYYDNNVTGVISLLKSCRENNINKIVFSSSCAVYGDSHTSPITEGSALNPMSPYSQSKAMGEQIFLDHQKSYKVNTMILRGFNVAGAMLDASNGERTLGSTHLVKVAAEAACGKRDSVEVFGHDYSTADGTCIRDYLHVLDFADLHVASLKHLENNCEGKILNCGYGRGFSVNEVVTMMKKVSGVDFAVKNSDRRQGDATSLVADTRHLKEILEWVPAYNSLETICRTALEWEKRLPD